MIAKEKARMRRLELENEALRQSIDKHFQVYREQAIELIELRAQIALIRECLERQA